MSNKSEVKVSKNLTEKMSEDIKDIEDKALLKAQRKAQFVSIF